MTHGFYGGKFMPMHKGHLYCIDVAARMCDELTVIMFFGGDQEISIQKQTMLLRDRVMLSPYRRWAQLTRVCKGYDNVNVEYVDVTLCKNPDGSEDWDAETPLVRKFVPHMDFVFSSEPSYSDYFARAYPEAKHIIIDAERMTFPISSTMIRNMKELEEKMKWMV